VQSIRDIIQAIARQRTRGENTPLIMLRVLDEAPGERISHLPVDPQLAQAWLAYSGEPFRPHQAHALAALRRGEPAALRSSSPHVTATLQLLARAALAESPRATVIVLAFDDEHAHALYVSFESANQSLPSHLQTSVTTTSAQQVDPFARIVIATPEALHGRVLRYHARAWGMLWNGLSLILIPDVHRYTGVAGAHLADLLMRAHRVAVAHSAVPGLLASLLNVHDPAPALTALLGKSWRVIDADDGPRTATVVAVWQGGGAWLRETAELATVLRRQSYRVHVLCDALERAVLAPAIGDAGEINGWTGDRTGAGAGLRRFSGFDQRMQAVAGSRTSGSDRRDRRTSAGTGAGASGVDDTGRSADDVSRAVGECVCAGAACGMRRQ
jgi:DEAD/DEAH box helicase domain-containing protein